MKTTSQPETHGSFRHDLISSIVVFLIALPLCMGIAIACGVPPALGLITGIIGGIVVGSLSGCPLQVSGPAAGLTVLVFDVVQTHGLPALGVVVLLGGAIQLAAGLLRLGRWFRAVSPAVIHGMMAGIGVLICASQFHVMFDLSPVGSGLPNLLAVPRALFETLTTSNGIGHLQAAVLGAITLATLIGWKRLHLDQRTKVPGHLPAILTASLAAFVFAFDVQFVTVPHNLLEAMNIPVWTEFGKILDARILLAGLSLALIASAETLLSATAVDQLHQGKRTDYNRELTSQGIGNLVCGAAGALPITGVIARSSVNVQAGARTRRSAILHGIWLLLAVALLPFALEYVPIASLAALLVFTGYKLIDVTVLKKLRRFGHMQATIYAATVGVIVAVDLLTGVLVGFILSLIKLVLTMTELNLERLESDGKICLELKGTATFLSLPRLAEALEQLPAGSTVEIDVSGMVFIDHSCLELLSSWQKRHAAGGGTVNMDWRLVCERSNSPADAA